MIKKPLCIARGGVTNQVQGSISFGKPTSTAGCKLKPRAALGPNLPLASKGSWLYKHSASSRIPKPEIKIGQALHLSLPDPRLWHYGGALGSSGELRRSASCPFALPKGPRHKRSTFESFTSKRPTSQVDQKDQNGRLKVAQKGKPQG